MMSVPKATTEFPDNRAELQLEFERVAQHSFDAMMESLRKVDLYKAILARLERGESIADEVPEANHVTPERLVQVVTDLMARAAVAVKHSWNLDSAYKTCFETSVRMSLPSQEIIPQFDVGHLARVEAGEVQVSIRTFRRNLEVVVQGSEAAVQQLWIEMSQAVMLAP